MIRSKEGIYNTIKCQEIDLPVAELLFDLKFLCYLKYLFAKALRPTRLKFSLLDTKCVCLDVYHPERTSLILDLDFNDLFST